MSRDPLGAALEAARIGLAAKLSGVDVREEIDYRFRNIEQSGRPKTLPSCVISGDLNNDPQDKDGGMFSINLEFRLTSNLLSDESTAAHYDLRLILWNYVGNELADDTDASDLEGLGVSVDVDDLVSSTVSVTIYV